MEEKETMEMSASANQFDTVPKMFWHGVQTRGAKPFCRQKEFGIWKRATWQAHAGLPLTYHSVVT